MNLLMILIIILAIWVCGAICYFAWRVMPDANAPEESVPPLESQEAPAVDDNDHG